MPNRIGTAAIGLIRDNPTIAQRISDYLIRFGRKIRTTYEMKEKFNA